MGVVDEAVEDGIAQGRIGNPLMPGRYGELASDDGGGPAMPVIDNLQQVASLLGCQWGQAPVVKNEQLDPGQPLQHAGVAPITAGQAERLPQPRQAWWPSAQASHDLPTPVGPVR